MKEAQRRTIYNNYNLWDDYEEFARENLADNGNENPSNDEIWEEIYLQDSFNWDDEKERLENFFAEGTWILRGINEFWYGRKEAGIIFTDFMDMFNKATTDCDYVHIYDENGHLFLKCSHHDGTNFYEIKKVTDKGIDYIDRWKDNWNDKRTEEYIHDRVMEKYSTLPHFAHTVYGCLKVEYKKVAT